MAAAGAAVVAGCEKGPGSTTLPPLPPPGPGPEPNAPFPLRIAANRRHLVDALGRPFFVHGDSPWSLVVQCTRDQIERYLDDRKGRGFNTLLINLIEHRFSSQIPSYRSVEGADPFANMAQDRVDFTAPADAYWRKVDAVIDAAASRGMAIIALPAYLGYGGGTGRPQDEGWDTAVHRARARELHWYGRFLGRRYRRGNVIWAMGGDHDPRRPDHQWHIALGIRDEDPGALLTGHGARGGSAHAVWSTLPGFNLNNIYCGKEGVSHALAEAEWQRAGPMPFFLIEGAYGNAQAAHAVRRQAYQAILSGACGHVFGTFPLWGFGEPHANGGIGAERALQEALDTPLTRQIDRVRMFFESVRWWELEPAPPGRLVLGDRGSGTDRVCAALTADRRQAVVLTTGAPVRIDLSELAGDRLRARWHGPLDGPSDPASSTLAGPLRAGRVETFQPAGESLLVVDTI